MSFKTIGNIDVTIADAYIAEPKWDAKPGEKNNRGVPVTVWGDLCIIVKDDQGNTDVWKGELSNRTGNGTKSHLEQTAITLERLVEIGFNVPTFTDLMNQCNDDNVLPNLIGMRCTVTTEEVTYTGKDGTQKTGIFTRYLNRLGAGGPKRMSKADFLRRVQNPAPAPAAQVPQYGSAPGAAPAGYYQQPAAAPAPAPAPANPYAAFNQQPAAAPAPAPAPGQNCPY